MGGMGDQFNRLKARYITTGDRPCQHSDSPRRRETQARRVIRHSPALIHNRNRFGGGRARRVVDRRPTVSTARTKNSTGMHTIKK